MIRILLRSLNAPFLVLLSTIAIALQTSLFSSYPLMYLQPDVILLAVIWIALKRDFTEGGIVTLILANVAEIHSASPQGLLMICYMTIYLLIRLASKLLVIPNLPYLMILTMVASVVWKIAALIVVHLFGLSGNQWKHTLVLLAPGAMVTGAFGFWIYRGLEWFDLKTYKNKRAEQHMDGDIQIDSPEIGGL